MLPKFFSVNFYNIARDIGRKEMEVKIDTRDLHLLLADDAGWEHNQRRAGGNRKNDARRDSTHATERRPSGIRALSTVKGAGI